MNDPVANGQVVRSDAQEFRRRLPELVEVYRTAFLERYEANPAQAAAERSVLMSRHAERSDLVLATVDDPSGLAGFCYSYRGAPGQWWHDVVSRGVGPAAAGRWLGSCREIVELHVRPDAQRRGLGRALLRAALDGAAETTTALSCLDIPDNPARALYEAEGFVPLIDDFRFPGTPTPYSVLAKDLTEAAGPPPDPREL